MKITTNLVKHVNLVTVFNRVRKLSQSCHVPPFSFFQNFFNIISPPRPESAKRCLSFRFLNLNSVYFTLPKPTCPKPRPTHPPWLDLPNNIWWEILITYLSTYDHVYLSSFTPTLVFFLSHHFLCLWANLSYLCLFGWGLCFKVIKRWTEMFILIILQFFRKNKQMLAFVTT